MAPDSRQSYLSDLLRRGASTFGRSSRAAHWVEPETAIALSGQAEFPDVPAADSASSVMLATGRDRSADSTLEPEHAAPNGGYQDSRIEAVHAQQGLTRNAAEAAHSGSSAKHVRNGLERDPESFVAPAANERTAMATIESFPPESEVHRTSRRSTILEKPEPSSQPRYANAKSAAARPEKSHPYKLEATRVSNIPDRNASQSLASAFPSRAANPGQGASQAKRNIASSPAEIGLETGTEPEPSPRSGADQPLSFPNAEINPGALTGGQAADGGAPLLTPAQLHHVRKPEAPRGEDKKALERAAPRLTIDRLEVRIVNEPSASKAPTVSTPLPPSPETARGSHFLDRHYLGRFYLSL